MHLTVTIKCCGKTLRGTFIKPTYHEPTVKSGNSTQPRIDEPIKDMKMVKGVHGNC